VSFPTGSFRRSRGLRLRPLPEREVCFVYVPKRPNLYTLNATAWMILELCRGQPLKDLQAEFYENIEPLMSRQEAADYVLACLDEFVQNLIVEVVPATKQKTTGRRAS
jgi:hypothetical protein